MNASSRSFLRRLMLAASIALLPASLAAQSVLIDFNGSSSIGGHLTKGTQNPGGSSSHGVFSSNETGGLAGTGAAATPLKYSDSFGYATQASFGGSFTSAISSVYFYLGSSWETGTSLVLDLGYSSVATPLVGAGDSSGVVGIPTNAQSSLVTSLRFSGSGGNPTANFVVYNNGANVTAGLSSTSASLPLSSWYYMETTFTQGENGTIYMTASLYSSSAAGVVGETALVSATASVTNTALLNSGEIYGYIGSQNGNRRGITIIDDLRYTVTAAVPEPSQMAGITGIGVLLLAAFRRLHRRR